MNPVKNIKNMLWHQNHFGFRRIIYSAGMPRSGSTLLFNMLKLILQKEYGKKLTYGWVEEAEKFSKGGIYLIKTHHLNRLSIWRSFRTFYTYRDIRDVLVSRLRKFEKEPTIEIVRYYIRQYEVAKKNRVELFRYETFITNQLELVQLLCSSLQIKTDPEEILKKLPDPTKKKSSGKGHDKKTLLHKGHVTGTKRGEWETVLNSKLQDSIHSEFEWWFKLNRYSI